MDEHDINSPPFRVGDIVLWYLKDGDKTFDFLDFEAFAGDLATVRAVYWNDSALYCGWLCDVNYQGKIGKGFSTDWFRHSKQSTLKRYFNG